MPAESRSRNGWRKTAPSRFAPGNVASTSYEVQPHFSAVTATRSAAIIYRLPSTSTAAYSNLGWYAMAMFAGIVHGVVVQMTPYTVRPARAGWTFAGSDVM